MDSVDRFGLEATFSFTVNPNTTKSIKNVLGDLEALQNALKNFAGDKTTKIPDPFAPHKGGGKSGAKQQIDDLKHVKAEFRALRAESRNISFGDLNDPNAFDGAKKGLQSYIRELETLKQSIKGNTATEREFKAQLEAQQRVAGNKIDIAGNQRTAAQSQQKMGMAGTVAATGAAALVPLVSVGKGAIDIVRQFDSQIAMARAMSGATVEESEKVRQKAKDLGAATKFSASEAASGFVILGQAGYNVENQLKAIDGTLMLAAAGSIDLAQSTDIVVSSLGGFQKGADHANHFADVIAQTASAANLGVYDIGETFKYAAPAAKGFGSSVEQLGAMTGVIADAGIKGSQAGTSLRTMFLRLGDPAKIASKQLKEYGIQVSDSSGKFREMPDILADMNKALTGVTDAKRSAFVKRVFGTEASSAVLALMGNLDKVEKLTSKNLVSSTAFDGMGVAAHQAEVAQDSIDGAFVSLNSALEGVRIELGDVLKKAVLPIVKGITDLARAFIGLPQPMKTALVVVGTIATGLASIAAIAGTLAFGFFALQSAMATAAIGMTTMATAGVPLTGFFATVMTAFTGQGIVGAFTALGGILSGGVASALALVVSPLGIFTAALVGLYAVLEYLTPGVNILGSVLSAIAAPIGFITGLVKGFATTLFSGLGKRLGGLSTSFKKISPIISFLGDAVKMAMDNFGRFFNLGESSGAGFANAILEMVDIVSGALGILWGILDNSLIKPVNFVVSVWRFSFESITNIASIGVSFIGAILSGFVNIVDQLLVKPIQSVASIWDNAFGYLNTIVNGSIGFITNSLSAVVSVFQQALINPLGTVANTWQSVFGFIANVARTGIDLINTILSPIVAVFQQFLINPLQSVSDSWNIGFSGISNIISSAVNSISNILSGILGIFQQFIIDPVGTVVNIWQSVFGNLGGIVSSAMDSVGLALTPFAQIPTFISEVVEQVKSIVSIITEVLTAPFRAATSTINSLWDSTGGRISGVFNMLTGKSAETGQNLVSNLAENSPGPTFQIREKWGMTADNIASRMEGLVGYGEIAGQSLSSSFVLPKVDNLELPEIPQLEPIKFPGIATASTPTFPITPLISPAVVTAAVIESTKEIPKDALQVPTDGVVSSVNNLVASLANLEPVQSVLTGLQTGFDTVKGTITGATLSAVGFAITGAVAIAPLLLGIGALGLLIGGIGFNFLGLRDIIFGVGKAVWSILDAGKGVALGLIQVFQGVIRFMQSIPSAITGDFSLMGQSLEMVWQGLTGVVTSFVNGVIGVFNGLSQSVRGIFTGLGQIIEGVFFGGWYRSIVETVNNSLQAIKQFGQNISNFISQVGYDVDLSFSSMFSGNAIASSLGFVRGIIDSFGNGVNGFINSLESGVKNSFAMMFDGSAIVASLNFIKGIISGFGNGVSQFINGIESRIKNSFSQMFEGNIIVSSLNTIKGVISGFGNGISQFINLVETNVKTSFTQMFSENVIVSSLNAVRGVIQGFGDRISQFINSVETNVKNSFSQMFSTGFLGAFISGLTNGLNGGILVIQGFVERGVTGFHSLFSGIQQGLNNFVGIFHNVLSGEWFNSLTQVLSRAKEVISGFVSSITSALNKPIEAVGNTANKIKGMLGIKPKAPAVEQPVSLPTVETTETPVMAAQIVPPPVFQDIPELAIPKIPSISNIPSIDLPAPAIPSPNISNIQAMQMPEIEAIASVNPVVMGRQVESLSMPETIANIPVNPVATVKQMALPEIPTLANNLPVAQQVQQKLIPLAAIPEINQDIPSVTQNVRQQLSPLNMGNVEAIKPKLSTQNIPTDIPAPKINAPILERMPDIPTPKFAGVGVIGADKIQADIHAVKVSSSQMADSVGNSFSGVGQLLSMVSPQLAEPVMAMGTFVSTGAGLGQSLKQLKEGMAQFLPDLGAMATGFKGMIPPQLSQLTPLLSQGTKAVSGIGTAIIGLVPGLAGYIASLSAAGAANGGFMATLTPILTGLLPFVAVIGAVVGSLALLKVAYDHNFLGLKDAVNAVITPIANAFNWISTQVKSLGHGISNDLGQGIKMLENVIKTFFSPVVEIIGLVVDQFNGIFAPIASVMSQFAEPLKAIGMMVGNLLIKPLQLLGVVAIAPLGAVFLGIKAITEILKPLIKIVGFVGILVVQSLLLPFRAVLGVIKAVGAVGNIVGNAFTGILQIPNMLMGVVSQIGLLMANVVNLITAPFRASADTVGNLWQNTGGRIGQMFGWLTGQASTTGQNLVSNLAENSPGPTFQIREKWGMTTDAISNGLGYLVGKGTEAGESLGSAITLPASIGFPSITLPSFEGAKTAVQGFVSSFSNNPLGTIFNTISTGITGITGNIQSATSGMMTFAIASMTGLAPLILTLAGVGLAIGAVSVNFLGLRDIVGGVARAVWSILQSAISVVTGIVQVFRGGLGFIRSIPSAITGDFTMMSQSLRGIWQGMRTMISSVFQGIIGVVNGVIQSIQGVFTGFTQVFRGTVLGNWFNGVTEFLNKARTAITSFAETVTGIINKPFEAVAGGVNKVKGFFGMGQKAPLETESESMSLPIAPQIKTMMSEGAIPKIGSIELPEIPISNLDNSLGEASNALGQFGSLASMVAPQFAAPIMAVSSFASTASGLVPTLITMFPALGGLIPVIGGLGASMMGLVPGLGAVTAGLSPLLVGFLPIVAAVGAVVGSFFLLKAAFENNFLGLADAVDFVVALFVQGFEFLKNAISSAIGFIGDKLTGMSNFYKETVGSFLEPIIDALQPLMPFFKEIGAGIFDTFVLPFKIVGTVVMAALQGIMNVVKPVVGLVGMAIGGVINSFMIPIRAVLSAVDLIKTGIGGVVSFFSQIPTMLGGLFANLWNLIPAPIKWLVENAMGGIAAIGGAFTKDSTAVPQFATGGLMPHEGLAYLHPNEFVVNPQATAGNMGALTQLNETGTLPTAIRNIPIPVPTAPPQTVQAPQQKVNSPASVSVSLTFGDVIIQNATDGVQAAKEFLDNVKPQFDRMVRDSLREMTELAK